MQNKKENKKLPSKAEVFLYPPRLVHAAKEYIHHGNSSEIFRKYYNLMKYKIFLCILAFLLCRNSSFANDIEIASFQELMNSQPQSGDTLNFTNDLNSDETIGQYFFNLDITFEGNNYYINGDEDFGGFVLNRESTFEDVGIRFCRGQQYNRSYFAGAIYNSGGDLNVEDSGFIGNFVDAQGFNIGVAGAVYNLYGGKVDINRTLFQNNYSNGASSYGGAVANGYDAGAPAVMTINNSIFTGNYAEGSVIPHGGAIFNNGEITVNNTNFENNYAQGEDGSYSYAGAIFNVQSNGTGGIAKITNSTFKGNYADSGENGTALGGAIYNAASLTVENTTFENNYASSKFYADGGAIYNEIGANLVIKDSEFKNNYIGTGTQYSAGGAIYNGGEMSIEGTTLSSNYDLNGDPNDIFIAPTGVTKFTGSSTSTVLSGIKGTGKLEKNGTGALNLGGRNGEFTGNFNFNNGTLNILPNSVYLGSKNQYFGNNVNLNLQNGQLDNINFQNLTLNGRTNIFADMNLNTRTMDTISADSLSGSGEFFVKNLAIQGTPDSKFIEIPFADSVLKDSVVYTPTEIRTPLYHYNVSYNSSDGDFEFRRTGLDSSLYSAQVATQLAGYLAALDTYQNVFANLDMVMITPYDSPKFSFINKSASTSFTTAPYVMPEQRNGLWFKPYSVFESVGLKNGPRVSNVGYGSIIGAESGLKKINNGWYTLYGAYVSYNGSHQAFQGNSIYNNGGMLGLDAVFYKGGFFSAWTVLAGASSGEASTFYGSENFAMFNTGIAEMTGYNIETLKRRLIIQPALLMSYTFVNTFDYKNASNISINTRPLNAIQIEPRIKFIGNFKDYFQPYISVSMVWNIIDSAKFQANEVYLPNLSVKPFVQYGAGIQKRWSDRVTAFFETMLRNGGRNGVALMLGVRISI